MIGFALILVPVAIVVMAFWVVVALLSSDD